MTAREMMRILRAVGAVEVRKGKGSHVRFQLGNRSTTVPNHKGEGLKTGTVNGIESDLEPVLGKGWLRRYLGK